MLRFSKYATMFPIEKFRQQNTPFYFYDLGLLRKTLETVKACAAVNPAFKVHYAMKANANPVVLDEIRKAGLGIDAVSGGEIQRAMECGFDAGSIVFAGVGKNDREIELSLEAGIECFNVESLPELEVINEKAMNMGKVATVALRVNPNIDAHTHHYITTGLSENKFGISREQIIPIARMAVEMAGIDFVGLHFHIGSQLTEFRPYEMLCDTVNELQDEFEAAGIQLRSINVGGGLGIDYNEPNKDPIPDFASYFDTFNRGLKLRPGQTVHFELGRSIVGQCGSLITRVLYIKKGLEKQFAIVDAGFTDLIRPALYQAYHKIENITAPVGEPEERYDVVGPICESSDTFDKDVLLPLTKRGDLLAIRSAGAYGEIMASCYNCRPLPSSIAE